MAWPTYHPHRTRFHGYCGILRLELASGRTSWTARLIVQAPTAIARACRTGPFARRGEARRARRGMAQRAKPIPAAGVVRAAATHSVRQASAAAARSRAARARADDCDSTGALVGAARTSVRVPHSSPKTTAIWDIVVPSFMSAPMHASLLPRRSLPHCAIKASRTSKPERLLISMLLKQPQSPSTRLDRA